jgi:hypothetical protein
MLEFQKPGLGVPPARAAQELPDQGLLRVDVRDQGGAAPALPAEARGETQVHRKSSGLSCYFTPLLARTFAALAQAWYDFNLLNGKST